MTEFFIPGIPAAQGRPRFYRRGNHVGCYDPEKSKSWKGVCAQVAMLNKVKPIDGPLSVIMTFYLPRPVSLPKKVIHHAKKPDLSNLVKLVEDALNGIAWGDDSQITEIVARKLYFVPTGDCLFNQPGVYIQAEAM